MSKVTDYAVLQQVIQEELDLHECDLVELIGSDLTIMCIMNIYLTNDVCKGFGQDFVTTEPAYPDDAGMKTSVISARQRISIITDIGMSYYKTDITLCGYEDVHGDIAYIIIIIQAVLDRIADQ